MSASLCIRFVFILTVALMSSASGAVAQTPIGNVLSQQWEAGEEDSVAYHSPNVQLVGQFGGDAIAVAVQGNHAYVGLGPCLTILDISDPTHPTEVGKTCALPALVSGVALLGDYAYVADGVGGLRVVDVSDLAHPAAVGFYDTSGDACGVAVAGDYAYVADGSNGLQVVDVSESTHPTGVGFYLLGDARDVAVSPGGVMPTSSMVICGWWTCPTRPIPSRLAFTICPGMHRA